MNDPNSPDQKVNVREMREEDLEGILAVDKKVIGDKRALSFNAPPFSFVGGEIDMSVVAELRGQVVGFLLGHKADSTFGAADTAWIKLIGIDPKYQRQGIGSELLEAFLKRCRLKGIDSMRIMVSWQDWWLLSFLRSTGFRRGDMAEFIKDFE
jgi:ribosomal protein S18 acetylase RimI-like enzyme